VPARERGAGVRPDEPEGASREGEEENVTSRDASFTPPGTEIGESRIDLTERCFGETIAFLHYNPGGPKGWASVALELSSGDILIIMAGPVMESRYSVRLIERWLPAQEIVTKRMASRYSKGRDARQPGDERARIQSRETGRMVEDTVQQRIEGAVIRGGKLRPEPNSEGGEILDVELADGQRVVIESFPSRDTLFRTELEIRLEASPRIISASRAA